MGTAGRGVTRNQRTPSANLGYTASESTESAVTSSDCLSYEFLVVVPLVRPVREEPDTSSHDRQDGFRPANPCDDEVVMRMWHSR